MDENPYDIAIIGGGLAGLSLAIQAADKGYRTILFEKEQYPFHKVCGEYISMESLPFLLALGVPLNEMKLPFIHKLNVSDIKGNNYQFNLPLGGFGISRFTLDHLLYQLALNKGIHIHTKTKVTDVQFIKDQFYITTATGNFYANTAAGTYGKRSNLDIKWKRSFIRKKTGKLNNYVGIKYHILYPQIKDTIALHNFENGYCGISAIEEDKCCLCYLITAKNLKNNNNSIQDMERNILSKNPLLKKIFRESTFLYDEPLAISQISFSRKSQVENHILFIGDAAGMITPLCGNGMSMAMHGSKLAFEAIDSFLQRKISRTQMEKNYWAQWNIAFAKRLQTGRIVQQLFGRTWTTSLFLKTMNSFPLLAKKIIASTHGDPF